MTTPLDEIDSFESQRAPSDCPRGSTTTAPSDTHVDKLGPLSDPIDAFNRSGRAVREYDGTPSAIGYFKHPNHMPLHGRELLPLHLGYVTACHDATELSVAYRLGQLTVIHRRSIMVTATMHRDRMLYAQAHAGTLPPQRQHPRRDSRVR